MHHVKCPQDPEKPLQNFNNMGSHGTWASAKRTVEKKLLTHAVTTEPQESPRDDQSSRRDFNLDPRDNRLQSTDQRLASSRIVCLSFSFCLLSYRWLFSRLFRSTGKRESSFQDRVSIFRTVIIIKRVLIDLFFGVTEQQLNGFNV